ncbi:MAG TPA: serine protease [Caulobacteraceae bacterium]|nr:serine protease [Caulobacteraceae bacterium]
MRWVVGAVAAATLAAAMPAFAQSWTPLGVDGNGSPVPIDSSNVTRDGARVTSWVRVSYAIDQTDAQTGKTYRFAIYQQVTDCTRNAMTVAALGFIDDHGVTVSSQSFNPAVWRFGPIAAGSDAELVRNRVCTGAATPRSLPPTEPPAAPTVPIGPSTPGQWRLIGTSAAGNASNYIDMNSLRYAADPKVVTFIAKTTAAAPMPVNAAVTYSTSYSAISIDCTRGLFVILATDYYDAWHTLVSTWRSPEQPNVQPIASGSVADGERAAVCSAAPSRQAPASEPQVYSGTAWLGPKGYLITAAHVVEGAEKIALAQNGQSVGTAEVIVSDPANDVAILKPIFDPGVHPAGISLRDGPAVLGERVFTLGYPAPDELGYSVKMTSGEVSALAGLDVASDREDDARLLQVSIPLQSGNSGGPVMDGAGRAVGIVISKFGAVHDNEVAQNVNFALKAGYVRNLLADLPDLGGRPVERREASITGIVRAVEPSVFLIIVEGHPADKDADQR